MKINKFCTGDFCTESEYTLSFTFLCLEPNLPLVSSSISMEWMVFSAFLSIFVIFMQDILNLFVKF